MGKCMFLRKGETHTEPGNSILASALAVGSTVKLDVDGVATEFLVVHQGLPSSLYDASCDGTWLLMKDCYEKRQWHSSRQNDYANSAIHSYLNGDFLNLFDETVQNLIKQVKVPYRSGNGNGGTDQSGANGLRCKLFLMSGYEVGFTTNDSPTFPDDGTKLDYFPASPDGGSERTAYLNGSTVYWWLRSAKTSVTTDAWIAAGVYGSAYPYVDDTYGIRPAFIIPSDTLFNENTLTLKP